MVVSEKYKYVFIELYFTGSTAIHEELCECYDGHPVQKKHAKYHRFLQSATKEEKQYFAFSGIRNPMDMVVSQYVKLKSNHKGEFTDPSNWIKSGGTMKFYGTALKLYHDIHTNHLSFKDYFYKYYKLPYDNWSRLAHEDFDYVIRFENIQSDFAKVLEKLNIEQKRDLPTRNKTQGKKDFTTYYDTPEMRARAVYIFGPFMKKWNYDFPEEWNIKKTPFVSAFLFKVFSIPRYVYWRYITKR